MEPNAAAYRHLVAVSRGVGPGRASPSEGVGGGEAGLETGGIGPQATSRAPERVRLPLPLPLPVLAPAAPLRSGEQGRMGGNLQPEQNRRELGLFGSTLSTVGRFLGGW